MGRHSSDRRCHRTGIVRPIPPLLIDLDNKSLEHVDILLTLPRPSSGTNGWGVGQPSAPGNVISAASCFGQAFNLLHRPTAHRERFASVTDCSMALLTHVANECLVLHADGGEPKLLLRAAVGADCVCGKSGQLFDGEFCLWVRHYLHVSVFRSGHGMLLGAPNVQSKAAIKQWNAKLPNKRAMRIPCTHAHAPCRKLTTDEHCKS